MSDKHTANTIGLIADIGGTHARFALADENGIYNSETLLCKDYTTIVDAVETYIDMHCSKGYPKKMSIAIAGPVSGDLFKLTNHPWEFSIQETKKALKLDSFHLMNDFEAIALGIPHLKKDNIKKIGEGDAITQKTIGIIGPGTGLGVGALFWNGKRYLANPCEGGHVTMAAKTQRQFDIFWALRNKYRHVSAERVCSGKGLVNLYNTIRDIDRVPDLPDRTPEEISEAAINGGCPQCGEALDLMLDFLGTVAGNLALSLGAQGGIYIAGGIPMKLGSYFMSSNFRESFEAKGRFSNYMKKIPTFLVDHPNIGFLGLQADLIEKNA